ncbi:MAG: shikimate dehydrogenase [Gemmatimonadaceae bacterium]
MTLHPGRLVLLGHPVAHSLSPIFQQAALQSAGMALRYEALDVRADELPGLVKILKSQRAAGNVTIPHKQAVAALCDRLTPTAERTGAVNTFWFAEDRLCGDNTDVIGFDRLVQSLALPAVPQRVLLLGAGGAAAAVCETVRSWDGPKVSIWSRSRSSAEGLARRFDACATIVSDLSSAAASADLIVNATPVGLRDDALPLPIDSMRRDAAVTDLVYRRGETPWVLASRAAGHPAVDGLVMLLEQGIAAFRRWFHREPDRAAMWAALKDAAR